MRDFNVFTDCELLHVGFEINFSVTIDYVIMLPAIMNCLTLLNHFIAGVCF